MNALRASFAPYWESIQRTLFPRLEQALGPLTEKQQQLETSAGPRVAPRQLTL